MEAIGAGANVLAFLTLGIKSAKTIHEILSLVKDGTHINRIREDVQGLQITLDRLSRSRAVAEIRDDALATKIKACANDVKTFADKLEKLTPDGTEPRLARHWKSVKALLNEKDLIDMGDVIVKHTIALSLYLKVLESDTLYEVQNRLATITQDVSVYQTGQATIIAQQTSMTSTLGAIKDETQIIQESIRAAQLQSEVQVNQFMRMFTELTERLGASSLAHGIGAMVVEEVPGPSSTQPTAETLSEEILPFHEILEGIQSILAAAQDKEGVFAYNDAEEIADALIVLLQTVISDPFLNSLPRFTAAYRSWCETCTKRDLADLRQNLRAVSDQTLHTRDLAATGSAGLLSVWRQPSSGALVPAWPLSSPSQNRPPGPHLLKRDARGQPAAGAQSHRRPGQQHVRMLWRLVSGGRIAKPFSSPFSLGYTDI